MSSYWYFRPEPSTPLEWLKSLKHDSELKISFWVNLAGDADFATAILFPVRTYLINHFSDRTKIARLTRCNPQFR
jgi:hypothetical protein